MVYHSFEDYIDNHILWTRFKYLNDLRKIIDNNLENTMGCKDLKVKDLCWKSEYDNDFQDWEVLVCVGTDEEDLYDVTLYVAMTRIEEFVVVESVFDNV